MSNLIYYILLFNFHLTSSFVVVFNKKSQIECKLFQFYPFSQSSLKIGKVGCLNLDERFSKDGFLYYAPVVIFGPNFIVTNKYEFFSFPLLVIWHTAPRYSMRKGRDMTATLSYCYHNDKKIDLTLYAP